MCVCECLFVIGNKNEEEADTRSCLYFKEENVLEIDLKIRIHLMTHELVKNMTCAARNSFTPGCH